MDEGRFRRADALLDAALDLPARDRPAFLDRECAGDPGLRDLVARLLRNVEADPDEGHPGDLLDPSLLAGLDEEGPAEATAPGAQIGPWRIEREIGRGGMAVVFLASRADGQFDQKVALKIIHAHVSREEAVRRFERERQILAAVGHPGIARLFDGGVTPGGEPYFVMEHVDGRPIDAWCDERQLGIPQRLEIFLRVARAVAYAHRNLIVHRDIKPGNILVTASGEVKLLDFGIAKPLGEVGDATELTRMGGGPMTPSFAAPEQIRGEAVTTAVDIWQLGVLLYLLLCGRMPQAATDLAALQRAILEDDPVRPSAAIPEATGAAQGEQGETAAVPAARATTPAQLRRALAGDLDNIVLKALRKEPERRYAAVSQLIEDIEAHLSGRTVSARPDTMGYRVSRFVQRHRLTVALGMTAVWLLIAFALTMAIQAGRIARERDIASQEREAARQVAALMVDLFEISDPGESRGNSVTAREILDRGAERIQEGLAEQPRVRSELQDTLGRVYQNLGLYDSAAPLLEQALATRRATLGPDHPDTVTTMKNLAWLLEQQGDYDGAGALHRQVLDATRAIHGESAPQVASALNNLALLLHHQGDQPGAEPLFREAIAMYERAGKARSSGMADAMSNLGLVLQTQGDLDQAEALYSDSLALRREILGPDHPSVAVSLDNLGRAAFDRGDMDEAGRLMREALDLRLRVLGEDHPQVATSLSNLGSVLYRQGDLSGAEEIFVRILEMDRRKLGEDHPDYGNSLNNLAHIRMQRGDPGGAEPVFLEAIAVFRRALPEGHWLRALARSNLGACLTALGRYPEAERELRAGHEAMTSALGPDHDRTITAANRLAELYEAWGRTAEAARYRNPGP